MGQQERNRAVAEAFDRSWSLMVASPAWWPSPVQVECTRRRREAGGLAIALSSGSYIDALGSSLRKWHAFRGARFDPDRLRSSLGAVAPLAAPWEGTTILTIRIEQVRELFPLFDAVREVKPTQRKWVVTSKALHHLLPDLIPPMDNQMTAPFLGRASLPATFDQTFFVESYVAFIGVVRDAAFGIGARRTRAAASQVPYPVADSSPRDGRIGLARVVDFAIAGYVLRYGRSALRSL